MGATGRSSKVIPASAEPVGRLGQALEPVGFAGQQTVQHRAADHLERLREGGLVGAFAFAIEQPLWFAERLQHNVDDVVFTAPPFFLDGVGHLHNARAERMIPDW